MWVQGIQIMTMASNPLDSFKYFIDHQMQMRAIYQPVLIRTVIQMGGSASRSVIAKEIELEDLQNRNILLYTEDRFREFTKIMMFRKWIWICIWSNNKTPQVENNKNHQSDPYELTPPPCFQVLRNKGGLIHNWVKSSKFSPAGGKISPKNLILI